MSSLVKSRVLSDIKKIRRLAKKVQTRIHNMLGEEFESGKEIQIDNRLASLQTYLALDKIIKLDIDELTRLQKSDGDKLLIQECLAVMSDAKKAMRDIRSHHLFDEIKQLMEHIIQIEKIERAQYLYREKELDKLYHLWYEKIRTKYLYHATSDAAKPGIKEHGLDPYRRPWTKEEFEVLQSVHMKGAGTSFFSDYDAKGLSKSFGALHFARNKKECGYYHQKAPAGWHERVRSDYNLDEAVMHFLLNLLNKTVDELSAAALAAGDGINNLNPVTMKRLSAIAEKLGISVNKMFDFMATNVGLDGFYELYEKLYTKDKRRFWYALMEANRGRITQTEVMKAVSVYKKLWKLFEESEPMLVIVSVDAPPIQKKYNLIFESFKSFRKDFKVFTDESNKGIEMEFKHYCYYYHGFKDIKIESAIPPEYIKFGKL